MPFERLAGHPHGPVKLRWDHDLFVGDVGLNSLYGPNGDGKTAFLGTNEERDGHKRRFAASLNAVAVENVEVLRSSHGSKAPDDAP